MGATGGKDFYKITVNKIAATQPYNYQDGDCAAHSDEAFYGYSGDYTEFSGGDMPHESHPPYFS